jgi:hypothetical protein
MTSSPWVKTIPSGISEVLRKKRNPTIEDFHFPDGLPMIYLALMISPWTMSYRP